MVSSQFRAMPSSFPPVPSYGLVVGTRGSLGRNSPLPIPQRWHPRALHCLRAYQLPKLGSALPGNSPSTPTWQAGAPGPFPRVARAQYTAHAPYGAPGPASAGHPCPLRYPGPPWALGLPQPTSPVPGVPTQRYSPFAATLPARQQGSSTPLNGFRAYFPTNSKTTSILSI